MEAELRTKDNYRKHTVVCQKDKFLFQSFPRSLIPYWERGHGLWYLEPCRGLGASQLFGVNYSKCLWYLTVAQRQKGITDNFVKIELSPISIRGNHKTTYFELINSKNIISKILALYTSQWEPSTVIDNYLKIINMSVMSFCCWGQYNIVG